MSTTRVLFGCDYCADAQNRLFGHVTQVASNPDTGLVLIECPRCQSLYQNTPHGPDRTRKLSVAEAAEAFPEWGRSRDIQRR
jgi:hypothetical protein